VIAVHPQQRTRLEEKLRRELGEAVLGALVDPDVIEVMLNPDGRLWLETHRNGLQETDVRIERLHAESLLGTVAAILGSVVTAERPLLEGELPDGSRFQGVLPPITSAPSFVIRKRARKIYSLEHYVRARIMEPWQAGILREAIVGRRNIVIAGGTGSGKTTLANALLAEMVALGDASERFVVLEDTLELQCSALNTIQLHTAETADLTRLVRTTMRLRPDRIIVGEVRGAEALALLKAWNTGHPGGLTTVHANSAVAALRRLETLIQEAGVTPRPELVTEAVGLLVFMVRAPGTGRKVTELAAVVGYDGNQGYQISKLGDEPKKEEGSESIYTEAVH
jgi:type IV secretion system protein VirB11